MHDDIDDDLSSLFGPAPDSETIEAEVMDEPDEPLVALGHVLADNVRAQTDLMLRTVDAAEARVRSPEAVSLIEAAGIAQAIVTPNYLDEPGRPRLGVDEWSIERHAVTWRAIRTLHERGDSITVPLVADQLLRTGDLVRAGGLPGLLALVREHRGMSVGTWIGVCRRVADEYRLRLLERACVGTLARIDSGERDAVALGREHISRVDHGIEGDDVDSDVDLPSTMNAIAKMLPILGGTGPTTLPTGFPVIDAKLSYGGMMPGELILVAARPGVGKTAWATDVLRDVCVRRRLPVGLLSFEMSHEAFLSRALPAEAGVPISQIAMPQAQAGRIAFDRVGFAASRIGAAPLYIARERRVDLPFILAKARGWRRRHRIRLLVVDYVQLAKDGRRTAKRNEEIGEVTRALKNLAMELEIPILALAQLNRDVERVESNGKGGSTVRRPNLADLGESGELERAADVVAFLFRLSMVLKDKTPKGLERLTEFIIAKNRNGPVGTVEIEWNDSMASYSDPNHNGLMG